MALKNGYARLKVRYEKLQEELAEKEQEVRKLTADKFDVQVALEKSEQARKNLHKYIDDLLDRESWLFKHSLWIVRVWFVKHFNLKR